LEQLEGASLQAIDLKEPSVWEYVGGLWEPTTSKLDLKESRSNSHPANEKCPNTNLILRKSAARKL
jgi:hypothetical protein